MRNLYKLSISCLLVSFLVACTHTTPPGSRFNTTQPSAVAAKPNYAARLPSHISGGKTILVDPNVHAWGAYDSSGNLIRAGLVTAGGNWCPDINRSCRTRSGTFYIQSLGHAGCKSTKYPVGKGGAPMPYCMYFNGHQGIHGSYGVVEGNVSHGCVRTTVSDAEWLRFNFANVGTKVIIRPY